MAHGLQILLVVLILLAGTLLIVRRVEVRLVLGLAGLALYAVARQPAGFFATIFREMANPKTIIPICAAMGFAYVLKLTECDRHLVHLLIRPLRRVRVLLVPGGVTAAFLVNAAIQSQTGTAAVVGPVLVPLLLAAGLRPVTAGAVLLLGSSMGGELLNPGAVEMNTLAGETHLTSAAAVRHVAPYNLLACGTAMLVAWGMALRRSEHRESPDSPDSPDSQGSPTPTAGADLTAGAAAETGTALGPSPPSVPEPRPEALGSRGVPEALQEFRVNPLKAAIPLLPIVLLFLPKWAAYVPPPPGIDATTAATGTALVIGTFVAAFSSPRRARLAGVAFFDGAGFAYGHVVSLIIVAAAVSDGITRNGVIDAAVGALRGRPVGTTVLSVALPWVLATVTGTGIGTGVACLKAIVPLAPALHLDPLRLGALIAISAQFGRTVSPVAPVVLLCATLARTSPATLAKRALPPLVAGGVVLILAAVLKVF